MKTMRFRAWDKANKRWSSPMDCNPVIVSDEKVPYIFEVIAEDYILVQSTGLRDFKGNEIYEGDIIRSEGLVWMVEYDAPQFILRRGKELKDFSDVYPEYILGNIFENPDFAGKLK